MIAVHDPGYAYPAWQTWLLVVACTALVSFFNIWGEPILPHMQNTFAPIYAALWLATIICLAATGPHVDSHTAILEFTDLGGWNNLGELQADFAMLELFQHPTSILLW